jgi:secreted PhoX family phosphatase
MKTLLLALVFSFSFYSYSQNIGDFTSITPTAQTQQFVIPSTHTFQKIIEVGDALTGGELLPDNPDFTGYVPVLNSSINGYLSINSETGPGGVTVLDINFNVASKLWETTASEAINFTPVVGTFANCSGTVTPWGTVISSEEYQITTDLNSDNYFDFGWNIEIDPNSKTLKNNVKLWALGNFAHENVTIHSNEKTVYQGADSNPGYLYKFVATNAQDLSDGLLYVYSGSKNGLGNWVLINNTTKDDRNNTLTLSVNAGATSFAGIEDVEIGPDGMVYFAVKSEDQVYRFQDSDPITGTTVTNMETFVGNMNYTIDYGSGTTSVPWSYGNDNLAFDGDGNLWVFQDGDLNNGDSNYIWLVKNGHTQANPKVEIFAITPKGSEPTGITFSPDYKYLFMSIQHPDSGNAANQTDAAGKVVSFSKGTTLVIALKGNLGTTLSTEFKIKDSKARFSPNPLESSKNLIIHGKQIRNVKVYSVLGKMIIDENYNTTNRVELNLKNLNSGLYLVKINNQETSKLIVN